MKKNNIPKAERGRPRKYNSIIEKLEPDALYSSSSIIVFAKNENLMFPFVTETCTEKMAATRLRVALNFFRRTRSFPPGGDGFIRVLGQGNVIAWFGWRWQKEYLSEEVFDLN